MIRLGLSSYALSWSIGVCGYAQPAAPLSAAGIVKLAAELGLHVVQIADNLPLHELNDGDLNALREQAEQAAIQIEVGTRGIAPEHLRRYIQIADFFRSPILRVVIDTASHHPQPDEIVTLISDVLPDLKAKGIVLAIENHDRFKAQTLEELVEATSMTQVGICLDTTNSFGSLEGPELVAKVLGRYVVNFHVKDFVIRRQAHNLGFEITGAPAGQGMLDIPGLLDLLSSHGRDFNAILELWTAPEATPEMSIAKEMAWVRESIAYLRTLIVD